MLRTTSGLSRPLLRWVSQVAASLGATLAATLIWSLVPHPAAGPAPPPDLTSGGKFAARAVEPVAYDGLDVMPLPHVAPAPTFIVATAGDASPPSLRRASWDGAALVLPERPARPARAPRGPARTEARRAEPVRSAAAPVAVPAAETAPEATAEEGVLHRMGPSWLPRVSPAIATAARDAWTATASAGDALVSRVVPKLP